MHPRSLQRQETLSHILRDAGTCNPQSIGNLPLTKKFWQSWRRDLNPRPSDYKSDALPTELRQHGANRGNITKRNWNCKGLLWKTCANLDTLPAGLFECPHPRSIIKSVLEKLFYTLEAR